MVFQREISFRTRERTHWVDVTAEVERIIAESGIRTGVCLVASLHTTGGVTINENADPDVERDFFHKLNRLIPVEDGYRHAEGNSDSHLKSSLVGLSVTAPVARGRFAAGTWQSIYFCEFDGPRARRISVTVMGE
jgi:secondary thiamine-phosphate synthase enzyme